MSTEIILTAVLKDKELENKEEKLKDMDDRMRRTQKFTGFSGRKEYSEWGEN